MDILNCLQKYISFSSVSADPAYKEGVTGACNYVSGLLKDIGFNVEIVQTQLHPIIFAQRLTNPDCPHVLIYGHYDVQPPDPLDLWISKPFEAQIREQRIYGRGATDNKGPFLVHLTAVAQLLKEDPDLPLNISFVVEGEEEIGSPSFPKFLENYKERLMEADFVYLSDTGSPNPNQMAITVALRGLAGGEIKIKGPNSDLHSGVYGGSVVNPINALTKVCGSLIDDSTGKININGFYDNVQEPAQWERDELLKLPLSLESYKEFIDVKDLYHLEGYNPFEATRFMPSIDFNGIKGGYQGEGSKTIIPSEASVKVTIRLVPGQDPNRINQLLKQTITSRLPKGIQAQFDLFEGAEAYNVVPPNRSNTPAGQSRVLAKAFDALHSVIADTYGLPPIYMREGGSIPIIAQMKDILGLDSIMLGLCLPEDKLHAPNESFHLGVMEKGVQVSKETLRKIARG